jgi:predicted transcriptional regulator
VERRTPDRATISIDAELMARLTELANRAEQSVDAFVERIFSRVAGADMCVERGVPVASSGPRC